MMQKIFTYKITKEYNQKTIEFYFKSFHFGNETLKKLIFNKSVYLNDSIVNDKNVELQTGDKIKISYNITPVKPYKKEINIIYEDDYLIAVKKQANILIHSDGNDYETLHNAVYNYCLLKDKTPYVYPVHRIDYSTTGIVVFAKDPLTLSYMSSEIQKHNCNKLYVCLCNGKFKNKKGIINSPIGKDRHSNKQIVTKTGKEALTFFEVLKNDNISKLMVNIKTGRTHQIRVHLKSINHPIVGDKIYGIGEEVGLKLHFYKFEFIHPHLKEKQVIICKEEF